MQTINLKAPLIQNQLPSHVSIIMDGNGRWATKRGLPRIAGHRKGIDALHKIIEVANTYGIKTISAWAFATANWNRPLDEVKGLMSLLRRTIQKDLETFHKKNARLRIIGNRNGLEDDLIKLIDHAEETTKNNDAITVVILFNYDGRSDILQATHAYFRDHGTTSPLDDHKGLEPYLMTRGITEPELLIRSSGLARISNYMIWQCAYSELYFTKKLWPDFTEDDFLDALRFYQGTERKFGFISAKANR